MEKTMLNRTLSIVGALALLTGLTSGAWAEHIPSDVGVCTNNPSICERVSVGPGVRTVWTIEEGTHSGAGHVLDLLPVDATTYRWIKNDYVDPGNFATQNWWGFEAVSEWDRYPLPWGNEVWSARFVKQGTDLGREALALSTDVSSDNELIYAFKVPDGGVQSLDLHLNLARLIDFQARPTASDSWTTIRGANDPGGGGEAIDISIPLSLTNVANNMTTFQVRLHGTTGPSWINGNFNVTAIVPEPSAMILLATAATPLVMRRRR
ncbi:MAG: hypothetical protein CMJ18_28235 [Phycisphaeraceae bacterium]|nr:hypothetical protein [Phycisphaeraceae bacterium]